MRVTIPMVRRMAALREAGLSCEAVARVIGVDYGWRPCAHTVRRYTLELKGKQGEAQLSKDNRANWGQSA